MPRLSTCLKALLLAASMALSVQPASAQTPSATLERIAETSEFRIGFVPDSPPMSFVDADGRATGYSIELCRHIGASLRRQLELDDISLSFVPLESMEERIAAVENGDVDIECGATTVTLSRRNRVDFTLMTFITGGAIVSRTDKPIPAMAALARQEIAVVGGTTTEKNLRDYLEDGGTRAKLSVMPSRAQAISAFREGKVDAYASDRAMLIGRFLRGADANQFRITQDVFSFEPYALMTRRGDTRFRLMADRALAELYRTARIRRLYHNWFGRFGEPLSPIVEAMYEFQAVGE